MKKIFLLFLCSSFMLSSCNTYTGSGAYAGSSIGSILGSAIGGIAGGPRGSDVGTLVGMAGGAAVGAIFGSQADKQQAENEAAYSRERASRPVHSRSSHSRVQHDEIYGGISSSTSSESPVFDSNNGGDDRLYDFQGSDYTGSYSAQLPTTSLPSATVEELGARLSYSPSLEIVNARFVDANEDNVINRGETCKLIFEIYNRSDQFVFNAVPTVVETTGNKHISISPSIHVEKIYPGTGVRYTAMVQADRKLKDGMARFCVSVIHDGKAISKVNEFNIPTKK